MKKEKYYPPAWKSEKFHCPHCEVYAKQFWAHIRAQTLYSNLESTFTENLEGKWTISKCEHCAEKIIWLNKEIIYPKAIVAPSPNEDLSENIKLDYSEAGKIFNDSPRASAALLRLALQKLCKQLGEKGENINEDIGNLVKKGLSPQIQKSLDILRITGNNAVHPGEINVEENSELVLKLFELINFIAEKMISEPKAIDSFYGKLPQGAIEQIKKRDT